MYARYLHRDDTALFSSLLPLLPWVELAAEEYSMSDTEPVPVLVYLVTKKRVRDENASWVQTKAAIEQCKWEDEDALPFNGIRGWTEKEKEREKSKSGSLGVNWCHPWRGVNPTNLGKGTLLHTQWKQDEQTWDIQVKVTPFWCSSETVSGLCIFPWISHVTDWLVASLSL